MPTSTSTAPKTILEVSATGEACEPTAYNLTEFKEHATQAAWTFVTEDREEAEVEVAALINELQLNKSAKHINSQYFYYPYGWEKVMNL